MEEEKDTKSYTNECEEILAKVEPSSSSKMPLDEKSGTTLKSVLIMAFNVSLTVSIVLVNKAIFSIFGMSFAPTFLLTLHQFTCAVGTHLFGPPTKPFTHPGTALNLYIAVVVLSRIFANVLVNLSLKFNTVGMYQLFKMLQIPFVFFGEVFFMSTPFRWSIAGTLVLLLIGITLATVSDVSFSTLGTICGCTAPFAAAVNSLVLKHVQVRYELTGNELLRQIAPWTVLLQLFIIPFTDDLSLLPAWWRAAPPLAPYMVLLSCLLAWGLEWSFIVVLHYTSAMTVQVLGHVKTMIIITAGFLLFGNPVSYQTAVGILTALTAVALYTSARAPEKACPCCPEMPRPHHYLAVTALLVMSAGAFILQTHFHSWAAEPLVLARRW